MNVNGNQTERELQKLRAILESTDDAIIGTTPTGIVQSWNRAAEAIFGYTAVEIIGKSVHILCPADRLNAEAELLSRIHRGERIDHFETIRQRRDGSLINISVTISPVYDAIGGINGTCQIARDITLRKRNAEQMRIAEAIFSTHEAIVITDANENIIRVNQAFEDITGFTQADALGNTPRILKSGHHDALFYEQMWQQLLSTDSWTGEIWDRRKTGEIYPKWLSISVVRDTTGNITHFVSSFTDISDRKASDARVQHLAYHDPLTGLANRFSLHENLTQALVLARRNKTQLALLLLDLDNFKIINDTLGHPTGDQLLVQVAQRLIASVRQSDFVARLGGDEFIIMLPDIESSTDVMHVAGKILKSISAPYLIDGQELRTSTSIGICLYPDDALDDQDLIKKADLAMYHAKSSGRENYQFFDEGMQQTALDRISIERDLRVALEGRQFMLHYQPQLDLHTGRLMGVEALVRWQHPLRGLVSPLEFIPVAEETGLIIPLGDWILQESCRQLAQWRADGILHIRMSVNLAATQFSDRNLPARIQEIMTLNGLPSGSIDLEVTESMTMKSPADAVDMMKVLTGHGQSLSIDDFGTGYSSLAYLKTFPISTLKIDRSFVKDIETDPDDASICDITVLLAHKLGMKVVAEGVETEAQLKYLLSIGCEKIQGYLISKPLPAEQAEHFIRNHIPVTRLGTIDLW